MPSALAATLSQLIREAAVRSSTLAFSPPQALALSPPLSVTPPGDLPVTPPINNRPSLSNMEGSIDCLGMQWHLEGEYGSHSIKSSV